MAAVALALKLESMRVDARVRADADIIYSPSGVEIAHDSRGTIKEVTHGGGLVAVLWDGMTEAIWTSFDSLEVLPS